jgi:hypothetical protein
VKPSQTPAQRGRRSLLAPLWALVLASVLGFGGPAQAAALCPKPDAGFQAFLRQFRSNRAFQTSRIVYPLSATETGPEKERQTRRLSRADVQAMPHGVLTADPSASNTGDRETDVCEDKAQVRGDRATLTQYSCHSDVFSTTYRFAAQRGCWFLDAMRTSGG